MDLVSHINKNSIECLNYLNGNAVEGALFGGLPLISDSDP